MTSAPRRAPFVVAVIGMVACSRAPNTGRLTNDPGPDDRDFAARAVAEYRQRVRPSTDAGAIERLARVARSLVDATKAGSTRDRARDLTWEIVLVDSPDTNVATFPTGAIFVEAGLLRGLHTDDALAAVIGQAMARALMRHSAEVADNRASGQQMLALTGMGGGTSRGDLATRHTEEADYLGLVLAVDAGYDPDRAVVLFDDLGLRERGKRAREHLPALRAKRTEGAADKSE
jgi:predicted Zn-dependent protease